MPQIPPTTRITKLKRKAGRKGGCAGIGASKVRGDAEYYRQLVAKREAKRHASKACTIDNNT